LTDRFFPDGVVGTKAVTACRDYVRANSQELSDAVCDAHVALYVNEFSIDLGDEGMVAIERLLAGAATAAA